ncbi:hypothetical protein M670_02831 [Schinkia azotoformans MEV2011]|uniref:Uncharacterized protein n=2 Tax=Schinkia azotoformans TaxID=1454 RepID=A0A072NX44_SCHAZ|nr:hypothetical protein [Schinkia azotoformans]KEF37800.1 hypothetical protein M670_02831 [Schinkia azotoformans MEV2011]MEC1693920.1 hypothetical protein [Schinkia azotoformans]MED4328468.1 hypothetical protein [Schinkia azotoformans]MED4375801.1 hypothetical protein [Schinkia azotoformans]
MYLMAKYIPVTLFSLRESDATNVVASTYLHPSPFCIKMTLVSLYLQVYGKNEIEDWVSFLKEVPVYIKGSEEVIVNNTMTKIRKFNDKADKADKEAGININSTVSYREFAYLSDSIEIAFDKSIENFNKYEKELKYLLLHVKYFGNRGSFFQWKEFNLIDSEQLPFGYTCKFDNSFDVGRLGLLKRMDDFDEGVTFEALNIYSDTKKSNNRLQNIFVLPYEKQYSSRSYTCYRRRG